MANKNQVLINLGKIKLTDEQRKSLHMAIHKVVAKEIRGAEKANTKKANPVRALAPDVAKAAAGTKTANLEITFTKTDPGDSELTATFNTQSKKIKQSGKLTFTGLSKGDMIEIDGTSIGSTTITIDISANPAVMNFTPGNFNDSFLIK